MGVGWPFQLFLLQQCASAQRGTHQTQAFVLRIFPHIFTPTPVSPPHPGCKPYKSTWFDYLMNDFRCAHRPSPDSLWERGYYVFPLLRHELSSQLFPDARRAICPLLVKLLSNNEVAAFIAQIDVVRMRDTRMTFGSLLRWLNASRRRLYDAEDFVAFERGDGAALSQS